MLRIIGLTSIWLVLTFNIFPQMVDVSRPYMGFSGLIRTVRVESYNCGGDSAGRPWRINEVAYDRRGKETWRAHFNSDGSVGHKVSSIYDADGNMIGWSEFYGKSDFPPNGLYKNAVFTLSDGKRVSSVVYKEGVPEFRTTLEYDARGNKIREVREQVGCCTTTRAFKYDELNREIEYSHDSYGLSSVRRRSYDTVGNETSETQYDKGVLVWRTLREFEDRRLIKEVVTSSDGNMRTTLHTYNKSGHLILTTIDDASIASRTNIEYHANGKIRSKDQRTVAKIGGRRQHSEATPNPGRILEQYDINGNQSERYIYDDKGGLYLTQMSSYNDLGKQLRLIETSSLGSMYDRDLVYEHDSHGNRIAAFCRSITATGQVKLSQAEKRVITYYNN